MSARDHDETQWLERHGWRYVGSNMWRSPDGGGPISRNDAIGMQNRRDELRRSQIPREIFHVVTKSGKIVGPAERTREDIEAAVKAANAMPSAFLYGPYEVAKYQLVVEEGISPLAALKQQHRAIDILFAMLVEITRKPGYDGEPFYPSKSEAWAAAEAGNKMIRQLEGE